MSLIPGLPAPPTRPEEYECCNRHCDPCIMDYYRVALERWKRTVREAGADPDAILGTAD